MQGILENEDEIIKGQLNRLESDKKELQITMQNLKDENKELKELLKKMDSIFVKIQDFYSENELIIQKYIYEEVVEKEKSVKSLLSKYSNLQR